MARWRELLGGPDQVRRFVERAMSRLDAPLEPTRRGTLARISPRLPAAVSERLAARGLEGTVRSHSTSRPPRGAEMVDRSHPLPATLAEACSKARSIPAPARAAARPRRRMAHRRRKDGDHGLLLRLRYKLTVHAPARNAAAGGGGRSARLRGRTRPRRSSTGEDGRACSKRQPAGSGVQSPASG